MDDIVTRYQGLQFAAKAVVAAPSLDVALNQLAEVARGLAHARYAALGVTREDRRGLTAFATSGMEAETIAKIGAWPRGLGVLGVLLRDPQPLRLRDLRQHPGAIGYPAGHPEMTSFLGVPILLRGQVLGNFYITDRQGVEEFSDEDQRLIEALAALAAIVIDNSRLHDETQVGLRHRAQDAAKFEEQLQFLVELSGLLPTGPLLADPPLEEVLDRATRLLGDACGVYLAGPDGGVTRAVMVHRIASRRQALLEFVDRVWSDVQSEVIREGRAILVSGLGDPTPPGLEHLAEAMDGANVSAAMMLPIRSARQIHGVFLSLGSRPLAFTPEDGAFGQMVAQRLGTAIDNSILLDEMRTAYRKLRELEQAREEFVSLISHDLRNPLGTLLGHAQLLRLSLEKRDLAHEVGSVDAVLRSARRMESMIRELIESARLESGHLQMQRRAADLTQIVANVLDRLETLKERERITLDLPERLPQVDVDPDQIERTIVNLVTNALKYSPPTGSVAIRIEGTPDGVVVSVRDQGVGISAEDQAQLFERYYRANSQAKTEGLGLGLYIARLIIEAHGGRIWVDSQQGQGSTFSFSLPALPLAA